MTTCTHWSLFVGLQKTGVKEQRHKSFLHFLCFLSFCKILNLARAEDRRIPGIRQTDKGPGISKSFLKAQDFVGKYSLVLNKVGSCCVSD